jgi:hypothetical protein
MSKKKNGRRFLMGSCTKKPEDERPGRKRVSIKGDKNGSINRKIS